MDARLKERIQKIEGLVAQIQGEPDSVLRKAALELVRTVMEFHAVAIDRMMELTSDAGEQGWRLIDAFGRDETVANVLLLHGLHPLDLDTRVRDALDKVRPYLQSHGGNVELVEIVDGAVRLKLTGTCNGCASSTLTLTTAIEKAIYETAPEVTSICNIGEIYGTSSAAAV